MMSMDIDGPAIVFCDRNSVVTHVSEPSSTLKKKNLSIRFHMTREAVAAGIIELHHIDGDQNPTNPLTKSETQWNFKLIENMFFYAGNNEGHKN